MKIAKILKTTLKEKNSPDIRFPQSGSNSFSFLTLHFLNFLTHFHEGERSGPALFGTSKAYFVHWHHFIEPGIETRA